MTLHDVRKWAEAVNVRVSVRLTDDGWHVTLRGYGGVSVTASGDTLQSAAIEARRQWSTVPDDRR